MGRAHPLKAIKNRFRRRDAIALGLIALLCAGVFGWAGAAFLPGASQTIDRQIVGDDYDALTVPIGQGGAPQNEIRQGIEVRGRLYGVRLLATNFSHVAHGTLRLTVLDAAGTPLTGCATDMTELLDNSFHTFIFDEMLDAGAGAAYTLVLTAEGEGPEDVIAFHKSAGPALDFVVEGESGPAYPLDGFELTEDGAPQPGTLALQYVTRYAGGAGGFIYPAYTFFAVLLSVFLLALYLLVFVFKWPAHRLFLVCGLVLGFVFMFLIPPRTAPDEYVHIATAYQYGNAVLGQGEAPLLTVRAGDEMVLHRYDFTATDIFAYQELYEGLFANAPGGEPVQIAAREAEVFPLMYAAPTLGVLLARLLGLGRVGLLLMGRLANLIFYTVLVSRAIKRMPLAKPMLLCAGLLPSALQLAASFSYDAYAIALAFYVVAFALQLGLAKEPATPGQLIGLAAAAVLLAPAKVVYILILAVVVFLPARVFGGGRAGPAPRGGEAGGPSVPDGPAAPTAPNGEGLQGVAALAASTAGSGAAVAVVLRSGAPSLDSRNLSAAATVPPSAEGFTAEGRTADAAATHSAAATPLGGAAAMPSPAVNTLAPEAPPAAGTAPFPATDFLVGGAAAVTTVPLSAAFSGSETPPAEVDVEEAAKADAVAGTTGTPPPPGGPKPTSKWCANWPRRRIAFCGGVLACALAVWVWGNWGAVAGNLQGVLGDAGGAQAAAEQQASAEQSSAEPASTGPAAGAAADGAGEGTGQPTGGQSAASTGEASEIDVPDPQSAPPQEAKAWAHAGTYFSPGYILRNPGQTIKMLGQSLLNQGGLWLQGLLGGRLGEPIAITLEVGWPVVIGLLLCLLAAAIPNKEDALVLRGKARLGLGAIAATTAAALLAIAVLWTPTDYTELFGFQGRYLLPVLPLALLAIRGKALQWKTAAWRAAAFTAPCLVVVGCLQVFIQVLLR